MNLTLLTSTRRHFLRRCGLLAGSSAVATALADPGTPGPAASAEPGWLSAWRALPRRPVRASRDPLVRTCLAAAAHGKALSLYYHGGATPGRLRRFSPELVFQLPIHEHRYVSGYCHLRKAPRVLRADRIALA